MTNEFCDVPQMAAILYSASDVAEKDEVRLDIYGRVLAAIKSEYEEFTGIVKPGKGSANVAEQKLIQRLYGKHVTVDRNFRLRAERHIRSMIKFFLQAEEVEVYLKRKKSARA